MLVDGFKDTALVVLDLRGRVVTWNDGASRVTGYPEEEIIGAPLAVFYPPEQVAVGHPELALRGAASFGRHEEEGWLVRKDGSWFWAHLLVTALCDDSGSVCGFGMLTRDVTAQRDAAERLRAAHARFAALVEHGSDLITITGADGRISYASPAITRVLGMTPRDAIGRDPREAVHPDDVGRLEEMLAEITASPSAPAPASASTPAPGGGVPVAHGEMRLARSDGSWRTCEVTVTNRLEDPAVRGVVATCRDVTERAEAAARLAYRADHDQLTGLPNRVVFGERLERAVADSDGSGGRCALLFVDLDEFKQVNDTLGHGVGDDLLVAVARRLRASIRPSDTLCRLGGDEFVIIAEGAASPAVAQAIAERVRRCLAAPLDAGGQRLEVSCSIGVALSDGRPPAELLRAADTALYRAKQAGRNRWALDGGPVGALAEDTSAQSSHLLKVAYEPVIDLRTRSLVAVDARATVPGAAAAVLERACSDADSGGFGPAGPPRLSVPVSARELSGGHIPDQLTRTLGRHRLRPEALVVEVADATLAELGGAGEEALHDLAERGVTVAVGGWGSGPASFTTLVRLPVGIVRIDRGLVATVAGKGRPVIAATVAAGDALGLVTVADGVDTVDDLMALRSMGCTWANGGAAWPPGRRPAALGA